MLRSAEFVPTAMTDDDYDDDNYDYDYDDRNDHLHNRAG